MHFHPSRVHPAAPSAAAAPPDEARDDAGLLRVRGSVLVAGDVLGGVSLGWGARLEVGGDVEGLAHLSPRSTLRVRGRYAARRVGSEGLVVVAGSCSMTAARTPGTVVEPGSLLHDADGILRLCSDGELVPLGAMPAQGGPWEPSGTTLRWSQRRGGFVPTVP